MATIRITEVSGGTSTNSDGLALRYNLLPFFKKGEHVNLSFAGALPMSSSFFNSSFGELIDEFGIDMFKKTVKPTDITKTHLDLIRKYIKMHTDYCCA